MLENIPSNRPLHFNLSFSYFNRITPAPLSSFSLYNIYKRMWGNPPTESLLFASYNDQNSGELFLFCFLYWRS